MNEAHVRFYFGHYLCDMTCSFSVIVVVTHLHIWTTIDIYSFAGHTSHSPQGGATSL